MKILSILLSLVLFHNHAIWFASSKIESSNEVVNITIYIQRQTNDPCPDMVSSIESDITVPVGSGNTYLFKFWKYNETTLDTTIFIPNHSKLTTISSRNLLDKSILNHLLRIRSAQAPNSFALLYCVGEYKIVA